MSIKDFIQKLKDRRAIKKENEENLRLIKAVVALAWDYKVVADNSSLSEYDKWNKDNFLRLSYKTVYTNIDTQLHGLKYWENRYNNLVNNEMISDDWKIERIIEYLRNKCNDNGDEE